MGTNFQLIRLVFVSFLHPHLFVLFMSMLTMSLLLLNLLTTNLLIINMVMKELVTCKFVALKPVTHNLLFTNLLPVHLLTIHPLFTNQLTQFNFSRRSIVALTLGSLAGGRQAVLLHRLGVVRRDASGLH